MVPRAISFDTYDNFKRYLDEYERQTTSHFITMKKEKKFSESEWKGKRLHWMDITEEGASIPYVIIGHLLLGCHQGRDKNVGKKEKYRQHIAEKRRNSPGTVRSRLMAHSTKKLDCPAVISLKKIAKFPEFTQELDSSKWVRRKVVTEFSRLVKDDRPIEVVFEFCAKFPSPDAHQYHEQGEFAGMREPVDPLVRKKVGDLVKNGVTRVPDIQEMVREYVAEELFPNETPPSEMRRRYNPTKRDILNISYLVRKKQCHQPKKRKKAKGQENDEECLRNFACRRKIMAPNDLLFLSTEEPDDSSFEEVTSDTDTSSTQQLLFCYQTQFQQRLLSLYGSLIILDIGKPSSRLPAVPVFLYVRTNVDFQMVAAFLIKNEQPEGVEEGIAMVRDWNSEWKPEFFLMDLNQGMMNVVKRVFPEANVYAAVYHFEKLVRDWLSQNESEVPHSHGSSIVDLVSKVGRASSTEQCEKALATLQLSEGWILSEKLQSWFTALLDMQQSWVAAFRPEKLSILLNVMNGADKLAELLRTEPFKDRSSWTLHSLMKALVTKIVPPFYKRYVQENDRGSSSYGKLHKSLPKYLENRPMDLVNQIKCRLPVPQTLIDSVIQREDGTYMVQASNSVEEHSLVSLGDESSFPSCQCNDWMQHWLPCQHLLAVFHHLGEDNPWDKLSPLYRDIPVFLLDQECITQQMVSRTGEVDPRGRGTYISDSSAARSALKRRVKLELGTGLDDAGGKAGGSMSASVLESIAFELIAKATASGKVSGTTVEQRSRSTAVELDEVIGSADTEMDMDTTSSPKEESTVAAAKEAAVMSATPKRARRKAHDPETSAASTCSASGTVQSRDGEEMPLHSLVLMRHTCGVKLKELIELIPSITDARVLGQVIAHLQLALQEAGHSSS